MKCPEGNTGNTDQKKFRECLINKIDGVNDIADEGNKLEPSKCLTKIKGDQAGCKLILNKMKTDHEKVKECMGIKNGDIQKCEPIDKN